MVRNGSAACQTWPDWLSRHAASIGDQARPRRTLPGRDDAGPSAPVFAGLAARQRR